jgi:citrate synthase
VCDSLARSLDAEREVITGRGHTVPSTGAPYNERLEAFMRAAEQD